MLGRTSGVVREPGRTGFATTTIFASGLMSVPMDSMIDFMIFALPLISSKKI